MIDKEIIQRIDQFVMAHHKFLTVKDMGYELDQPIDRIYSSLDRQGLRAVSQKDMVRNYILEVWERKPLSWVAARLELNESYVAKIYRELDLQPDVEQTSEKRRLFANLSHNYRNSLNPF